MTPWHFLLCSKPRFSRTRETLFQKADGQKYRGGKNYPDEWNHEFERRSDNVDRRGYFCRDELQAALQFRTKPELTTVTA
jgi:hypothetical protein